MLPISAKWPPKHEDYKTLNRYFPTYWDNGRIIYTSWDAPQFPGDNDDDDIRILTVATGLSTWAGFNMSYPIDDSDGFGISSSLIGYSSRRNGWWELWYGNPFSGTSRPIGVSVASKHNLGGEYSLQVVDHAQVAHITDFQVPTGTLQRGQNVEVTIRIMNTGTTARSFWVGLSYSHEDAAPWPGYGWYDVPPLETAVVQPGTATSVTFSHAVPAWLPPGNYTAHAAVWSDYDRIAHLMLPHNQPFSRQERDAFVLPAFSSSMGGILDQLLEAAREFRAFRAGEQQVWSQYDQGHKPLLFISAPSAVSIVAGSLLEMGAVSLGISDPTVVFDLADLLGITPEGQDGLVTVWFDGSNSISAGIPGSPVSLWLGDHSFYSPDSADVRDSLTYEINAKGDIMGMFPWEIIWEYSEDGLSWPRFDWARTHDVRLEVSQTREGVHRVEVDRTNLVDAFKQAWSALTGLDSVLIFADLLFEKLNFINTWVSGTDHDGNWAPDRPVNTSPVAGATDVPLAPILWGSRFQDRNSSDYIAAAHWLVDDSPDLLSPVFERQGPSHWSWEFASGILAAGTTYYWKVRYQDSQGKWSEWSAPTSFTTTQVPTEAEIAVYSAGTEIWSNSQMTYDFGNAVYAGTPIECAFTIYNLGQQSLDVGTIYLDNNTGFTVTQQPANTVAGGGSTVFKIRMSTDVAGGKAADVRFSSNDADENPFRFKVAGTVVAAATNQSPNTPAGVSPSGSNVSVTPTLQSSSFIDPNSGDTHAASQWQISTSSDSTSVVWDSERTTTNRTSIAVPEGHLEHGTTYYWRVRHQDSSGEANSWSEWSTGLSFTTVAAGYVDQSNLPSWGGGWTHILPAGDGQANMWQVFTPNSADLIAVELDLITSHPGSGDDTIVVEIARDGQVIASTSQVVQDGFNGLLRFDFASAVPIVPGQQYELRVWEMNSITFGWKYAGNTYERGVRYVILTESPGTDWFFQTYSSSPPAAPTSDLHEDFEAYGINSWPSSWAADGNAATDQSLNRVEADPVGGSNQVLRMYGVLGSSWAALTYHPCEFGDSYTLSARVFNGSEPIPDSGHQARAGIHMRHGAYWYHVTNPSLDLIRFMKDGSIIAGDGTVLQSYSTGQWYDIEIDYERRAEDILLSYRINGTDRGTVSIAVPEWIDDMPLDHVGLDVQAGTAYFDDVTVVSNAANSAPSLTAISTLTGAIEDGDFIISYETLLAASDASDVDGDTIHFRIEEISSGTLTKGGATVEQGTTLLSPSESLTWRPATDANGTLGAFTVVAWDGQAASESPVQVRVDVTPVNDVPVTPGCTAPEDGQVGAGLTPTLESSGFSDPDVGDMHAATQWQVDDDTDFSSPAWDYEDTDSDKTAQAVPSGVLSHGTTYHWRVRHQDSGGAWSEWSVPAQFTTMELPPDLVVSGDLVIVTEGSRLADQFGRTFEFYVKLAAQPGADVTVNVAWLGGDSDITVSNGSVLTFTAANWDAWQAVALVAAEDADTSNGTATIRCSVLGGSYTDITAQELDNDIGQPVYRFWSPAVSHHFYTMDEAERNKLIDNYSHVWAYEGVAYYAYADDTQAGTAAIYRFWSPLSSSHFYTMDVAERDKLINDFPHAWTYEGVAYFAYSAVSAPIGSRPVYRFWSPVLSGHFYTMDEVEKDSIIANYPSSVWAYEGTAWYALPSPVAPTEVNSLLSISLGWAGYDMGTGRTSGLMTIRNASASPISGPLWIAITSISDPWVTLAESDGTTADGYQYIDVTRLLTNGGLDPDEDMSVWLYFDNPLRSRFEFTYSIRGVV